MKSFLAILLSLVLILALNACSNEMIEKAGAEIKDELGITNGTSSEYIPTGVTPAIGSDETQSDVGYATSTDSSFINRDRAIEIALNHAGLTKTEVRDLEAELDYERNGVFWEVDFEANGLEYSYDVNAETEEVARLEKERD